MSVIMSTGSSASCSAASVLRHRCVEASRRARNGVTLCSGGRVIISISPGRLDADRSRRVSLASNRAASASAWAGDAPPPRQCATTSFSSGGANGWSKER